MALNRFNWVRAALVGDAVSAGLGREHNDANVLVLGQRMIESRVALECVDVFLSTAFEGGRHQRRVDKLGALANAGPGTNNITSRGQGARRTLETKSMDEMKPQGVMKGFFSHSVKQSDRNWPRQSARNSSASRTRSR